MIPDFTNLSFFSSYHSRVNRNPSAALAKKLANAKARAAPLEAALNELVPADEGSRSWDINYYARVLNARGFTAPRGGPVTYNTVLRILEKRPPFKYSWER